MLTLFVSTNLLAQQANEIKVKVEYKDVTPRKPVVLDYVTPMKESLDQLDRIAKEKSRQYEQPQQPQQSKISEDLVNRALEGRQAAHEKYLRIIGLGVISKIMSLENGVYRGIEVRKSGKNKEFSAILDSDTVLLTIKNNKITIIRKQEFDEKNASECNKYLLDALKTGSDESAKEYEKCAKKYTNEVKYFVGDHFINSKLENGIISIIDIKTYETKEFILVDEIIRVLGK